MDTILVFLPHSRHAFGDMLAGVARRLGADVRLQTVEGAVSREDLARLLAFWHPRGCIVEASEGMGALTPARFAELPVVYLDRTPLDDRRALLEVRQDYAAAGETAARELLSPSVDHYVYVEPQVRTSWSISRGDAFAGLVRLHGKTFHRFNPRGEDYLPRLKDNFAALPRPCAVFCANDAVAEDVLAICQTLGAAVPGDVTVLGVDNDVAICESARPQLSSICPDFELAGWHCADLLEARVRDPRLRYEIRTYGLVGVLRRTSTCAAPRTDRRVLAALALIRERSAEKLAVAQVAAAMGCSVRTAQTVFRETTGRTIREEIAETRFQHVCTLLKNPNRRLGAIAQFCGYGTEAALRIAFRKRTGLSMRAYRATRCPPQQEPPL